MKTCSILLFLCLPFLGYSQSDSNNIDSSKVYQKMVGKLDTSALVKFNALHSPPQFKGGMQGFAAYLKGSLVYPDKAKRNGTSGKVLLSFVVERDGSISNVVVEKGIGDGCDEAAVKAIQNSPAWIPGVMDGRPVRVKYNIPLSFGAKK